MNTQLTWMAMTTTVLTILSAPSGVAMAAQPYAVDAVHSTALFAITHLGTSRAWGRFNDLAGKLDLDGPAPAVEVQIKTDSIDTANAKRDQHLKGPDFFNARQFPTITFKSSKVTPGADGSYEVDGSLTLHGVSKPLTVKLAKVGAGKNQAGDNIVGYETQFSLRRSDFGMKYLLEGLGDDVTVIVSLEAGRE